MRTEVYVRGKVFSKNICFKLALKLAGLALKRCWGERTQESGSSPLNHWPPKHEPFWFWRSEAAGGRFPWLFRSLGQCLVNVLGEKASQTKWFI